jgi:hypothetical protein
LRADSTIGRRLGSRLASRLTVLAVLGLAVAAVLALTGCGSGSSDDEGSGSTTSTERTFVTGLDAGVTTTSEFFATGPVSEASLEYARSLGGTSRDNEDLYLVVGASARSEAQALGELETAKTIEGQDTFFIVQLSENFDGLLPGHWVVIQAYEERPSVQEIDLCRRAFPRATVERVRVRTEDPIPVRVETES